MQKIYEKIEYIEKHIGYLNIKLDSNLNQYERTLIKYNQNLLDEINNSKRYWMSIVIPFYNTQKYIEDCFLSIINQSIFDKLEIIFVDDCSTDNGMEVVKSLKNNFDNVKVFKTEKNSGYAGQPRNIALKYVTTDYVLFLDSDDVLIENSCENLLNKIRDNDADMVIGKKLIKEKSDDGKSCILQNYSFPVRKDNNERVLEEKIINNIAEYPELMAFGGISSSVFSVKFLKDNDIHFPEYIPAQDSFFLFKSILNSKKTIIIQKDIYIYNFARNSDGDRSQSHIYDQKSRLDRLKSYNMMLQISQEKNIEEMFVVSNLSPKMRYFYKNHVLPVYITENELKEIFDKTKDFFKLIVKYKGNLDIIEEISQKILNNEYDEAIKICNSYKK